MPNAFAGMTKNNMNADLTTALQKYECNIIQNRIYREIYEGPCLTLYYYVEGSGLTCEIKHVRLNVRSMIHENISSMVHDDIGRYGLPSLIEYTMRS